MNMSNTAGQIEVRDRILRHTDTATRRTLLRGAWLVDMVQEAPRRADILIVGDVIEEIGPDLSARIGDGVNVVDIPDAIVAPGLIDCHNHTWEGALRGVSPTVRFGGYWSLTHGGAAVHCTPDDLAIGQKISIMQALNAGTTTIIDDSHNIRTSQHADAVVEATRQTPIRSVFAPGRPQWGEFDDIFPNELLRLRDAYFPSDDGRITLRAFELEPNPTNLAWDAQNGFGVSAELGAWTHDMSDLFAPGVIRPDQAYNHCVGLPDEMWKALTDGGAAINLVARSDEQYAFGFTPVLQAQRSGLQFGISSDNETAYAHDLFTEMRTLLNVQRGRAMQDAPAGEFPTLFDPIDVLRAATVGGAVNAGLSDRVGTIEVGKKADLIVVSLRSVTTRLYGSITGTLVNFTTPSDVEAVFVDGTPVKWGGELLGFDIDALVSEGEASRTRLMEAAGFSVDEMRSGGLEPTPPPGW